MSILASLNSNALDIDQALYLQTEPTEKIEEELINESTQTNISGDFEKGHGEYLPDELEDDLMNFDWDKAKQEQAASEESSGENVVIEDVEDLLGSFLSNMNK